MLRQVQHNPEFVEELFFLKNYKEEVIEVGQEWRCQSCDKPLNVQINLNKPRKIKCRKCGHENKIGKEKNGKFRIN